MTRADQTQTGPLRVPRFRPNADWYVARRRGGVHELYAWAAPTRLLSVFTTLCEQLDAHVDVSIEARQRPRWRGELLPQPLVLDALRRLSAPLAAHGGVELSVYTADDQLTITDALLLTIYARSDRWVYLLEDHGFEERVQPPPPAWDPDRAPPAPAPALDDALHDVVERLALVAH